MTARSAIAIEISERRLRALAAVIDHGSLQVRQVLVADVPASIDGGDAVALGRWIGRQIADAQFPRGRVTIALARVLVGLKRFTLPTCDDNELPEMTRLALQRELPFDADRAVIDFVPVGRSATTTTVLAVAAPEDVLQRARATADAAGLLVERVGLRSTGSAALIRSLPGTEGECLLTVDVTSDAVEFCVLEDGAIRFSRAAPLPRDVPETPESVAAAVITETRRTWMSYRIVEDAADVMRVVVMGDRAVAEATAQPLAEILGAEVDILRKHPRVRGDVDDLDRLWPLAGLLLEPALDGETIDFARPRRSVDRAALVRRRGVMAVGLLGVLLLGGWTLARRSLGAMERHLDGLRRQETGLLPDVYRYQRDRATLDHVARWEQVDARWLDHLVALHEIMPPPSDVVLDGWTGTLDFAGVRFDRTRGEWLPPAADVAIVLDGEAKDRATADALRDALVRSPRYRASSAGADAPGGRRMPYGFLYRLSTDMTPPESLP